MSLWPLLVAAVVLSLERVCYVWIWRAPEAFRAFCARPAVAYFGQPVDVIQTLSYGFKGLQLLVFLVWCSWYGSALPLPLPGSAVSLGVGGALIIAGQMLNLGVFYRLGKVGVFYGNKFGHAIPWCQKFPFSRSSAKLTL